MKIDFAGFIVACTIGALNALIFMLLFNYFSLVFNMPKFGFWESWGLLILIGVIGRKFTGRDTIEP